MGCWLMLGVLRGFDIEHYQCNAFCPFIFSTSLHHSINTYWKQLGTSYYDNKWTKHYISVFMRARVKWEAKRGRTLDIINMCRNYYLKSGTIVNSNKDNTCFIKLTENISPWRFHFNSGRSHVCWALEEEKEKDRVEGE